jgi:hypothetical protein
VHRESVAFTSIVKHKNESLGEGYGVNYRVRTELYAGFVPGKVTFHDILPTLFLIDKYYWLNINVF